jgi:hypothetical protein
MKTAFALFVLTYAGIGVTDSVYGQLVRLMVLAPLGMLHLVGVDAGVAFISWHLV